MRDIAIIGGGLVGLCAALALEHPQRRVTIVEAGSFAPQPARGLAARSIALSFSSVQILRALGLWPQIEAQAAPIRQIHVSARAQWGVARLRAGDYDLDALGYVIENQALTDCLLSAVQDSPRIELREQAAFERIAEDGGVRIGFRQDDRRRRLQARLALVADGAQSQARAALGIGHQRIDYGQSVVISNVEVSRPCEDTAYERFTSSGPLAMLPLGGPRYACVWTMTPAMSGRVVELDDAEFAASLQECFGHRLGFIERASRRFCMPLQRTRADTLRAGRCLLIGNAANALHPVAGQSFNLALRDVASLYELLCDRPLEELDDAGIDELTGTYERQRLREQARVIRYGDGLVTLFSNDLPALGQLRAGGLALLDLLPALKAQAAFSGMGLTFGGNRLLRGHL